MKKIPRVEKGKAGGERRTIRKVSLLLKLEIDATNNERAKSKRTCTERAKKKGVGRRGGCGIDNNEKKNNSLQERKGVPKNERVMKNQPPDTPLKGRVTHLLKGNQSREKIDGNRGDLSSSV